MKFTSFLFVFFIGFCARIQNPNSNYRTKKVGVNDTIVIDSASINPNYFSIKTKDGLYIDASYYTVDFPKAIVTFKNRLGNQQLFSTGLQLDHPKKGVATYEFQHLGFSENFNGNRQVANLNLLLNKFNIVSYSSFLNATSDSNTSTFLRTYNRITYGMKRSWLGAKLAAEDNKQKDIATSELTPLSQKFKSYELFLRYWRQHECVC